MCITRAFGIAILFSIFVIEFANAQTSATNRRLREALERYPEADADGDGILTTEEGRAFQRQLRNRSNTDRTDNEQETLVPTHGDIAYGPHQRNSLDLWIVESRRPTPLLICIHGGGFRGGDKQKYRSSVSLIESMHEAGISVASINYRLTDGGRNPYPIPMHDSARAVQFLRHHSERYNLDKTRFAATGGSAGGCISMWLGFHDDLIDPDNSDPVLRESTRLCAMAPNGGQSCLHMPTLCDWFDVDNLVEHGGGRPLFAIPPEGNAEWTTELDLRTRDASPITHLTQDDPPCYLTFGRNRPVTETTDPGVWVHHPIMGIKLKEAMDELEIECHVQFPDGPSPETEDSQTEFLIRQLSRSR